MDREKVFVATAAIYSAVTRTAANAGPNPDARAELESEIDILRDNCPGNCMGTVLSLSSWLDIFYSAHRHQRYADPANDKKGIEVVMADICLCLRRIDDRVRERPNR